MSAIPFHLQVLFVLVSVPAVAGVILALLLRPKD